jgi:hypothetical protein
MATGPEAAKSSRELHKPSVSQETQSALGRLAEHSKNNPGMSERISQELKASKSKAEVGQQSRKMAGEAKFKAFNETVDKSRQNWERATQIRDTMKDFKAGRERFQAEKAQGNKSNINPEVARINAARPAMEKALAQERSNQPLPQRESQLNQQTAQSEQAKETQQTEAVGTGQTNLSELPAPPKYAAERRSARLQGERNQLEKEKTEAKKQAEKEKREIQQKFEKLIKEVQDKAKSEQAKLDEKSQSVKQMLEGGVNALARVGLKHELGKLDKASEKLGRQTKESIKDLEKRRDGLLKEVEKSLEKRTNSLNKLLKETNRSIGRAEFAANLNRKAGRVREFLHSTREAASKGIRAGAWELAGRAANSVGNYMQNRANNLRQEQNRSRGYEVNGNVITLDDSRIREATPQPEQQRPGAVAA